MFHSHNGKAIKTLSNSVISECISLFYGNDVGKASKYCWGTELHLNIEVSFTELFFFYIYVFAFVCSLRWKQRVAD